MVRSFSIAIVLAATIALPAIAQTTTAQPSTLPSTATAPVTAPLKLTADEAKSWVDKPVYSSDTTKLGEVAGFTRGTDNSVNEMQADIGGFLGMGETRIKLVPAQFTLHGDRVVLNVTAAQAKTMPSIAK